VLPVGWDPYFRNYMTLADGSHYPTQHYGHNAVRSRSPRPPDPMGPTADLLPNSRP